MREPYVVRIPAVSIRSLTSNRFPASGPGRGSARSSTRVMTALYSSVADNGDGLDLDLRAGDRQPRDLDQRARGAGVTEELLPHRVDPWAVVDVRQEDRHLGDVRKGAARRSQHGPDVDKGLSSLRDDVAITHEAPLGVHRDATGDEHEVAHAHGVRVVADRLGLPRHPDLLTRAHEPRIIGAWWSRSSSASTTCRPSSWPPASPAAPSSARARCST